MVNLTADQARQQLVLLGGRNQSMQESLRAFILREPRLTGYLDQLARDIKTVGWDIKEAGGNITTLYQHIWPAIDFEVVPAQVFGVARVSPLDTGWPRRRTGRPIGSEE